MTCIHHEIISVTPDGHTIGTCLKCKRVVKDYTNPQLSIYRTGVTLSRILKPRFGKEKSCRPVRTLRKGKKYAAS